MRSTLRLFLCAAVAVLGVGAVPPAAMAADDFGTLTGTVLDATGQPFDAADVLLTSDCGQEFCGSYYEVDAAGRYEIGGLVAGADYCARFYNSADEETFCFTAATGILVHDVTLARPARTATIHGTVTDVSGTPVDGARVWFSATYDALTDVDGRYEISLPAGEHQVEVWLPVDPLPTVDVGVVTVVAGGNKTYDIRLPAENETPQGSITWSRGNGRLVVGGRAADDSAVLKIRVAVLNRTTGKWLRANGRWGDYTMLPAHVARSKARSTNWRFGRSVPRGDYGVSLIVIDDQRTRNLVPRPWKPVRVKR